MLGLGRITISFYFVLIVLAPEYPTEAMPFFGETKNLFGYIKNYRNIDTVRSSFVVSNIFYTCQKRFTFSYEKLIEFPRIAFVTYTIQLRLQLTNFFKNFPIILFESQL